MNNLLSYCGLTNTKIRASDKDLPVQNSDQRSPNTQNQHETSPLNDNMLCFSTSLSCQNFADDSRIL